MKSTMYLNSHELPLKRVSLKIAKLLWMKPRQTGQPSLRYFLFSLVVRPGEL